MLLVDIYLLGAVIDWFVWARGGLVCAWSCQLCISLNYSNWQTVFVLPSLLDFNLFVPIYWNSVCSVRCIRHVIHLYKDTLKLSL